MKIGIRTPSLKKSISARTTGRAKRAIKSSINPTYGKKGMGWINNPSKAAYNKVYNKTTVSAKDLVSGKSSKSSFLNFCEAIICGIIGLIFILGIVFIIVFLLCLFL